MSKVLSLSHIRLAALARNKISYWKAQSTIPARGIDQSITNPSSIHHSFHNRNRVNHLSFSLIFTLLPFHFHMKLNPSKSTLDLINRARRKRMRRRKWAKKVAFSHKCVLQLTKSLLLTTNLNKRWHNWLKLYPYTHTPFMYLDLFDLQKTD